MTATDPKSLPPRDRLAYYKTKAEESYARMYDCAPHNLKDHRDDASLYFRRAIEAAEEAGLSSEKVALEKRAEAVEAIFNQLRTDGGRRDPVSPSKPRLRERMDRWVLWLFTWGFGLVFLVALVLKIRYELTK